ADRSPWSMYQHPPRLSLETWLVRPVDCWGRAGSAWSPREPLALARCCQVGWLPLLETPRRLPHRLGWWGRRLVGCRHLLLGDQPLLSCPSRAWGRGRLLPCSAVGSL